MSNAAFSENPPRHPDDRAAGEAHATDKTRLRELMVACLERVVKGGEQEIECFLEEHPADAAVLRERIAALRDAGVFPAGTAPVAEPPRQRLGDFLLVRRLGEGGMGVVHLAVQESLGREVALKMIRPEHLFFPGSRERFRREVESVARLQHPGIVPIYLVGEEGGVPFFAMELVHGKSLGEIVAALRGERPENLTASRLHGLVQAGADAPSGVLGGTWVEASFRLVLQVADALAHAHERGVLHRDIKPSNVMVTPAGRAVLLDFGLASIEGGQSLTRTGHHVGSLPYMAPEQVLGQSDGVGPWTDVYALGVTLFELLTLSSPFESDTTEATRSRILAGESRPPRTLNPAIPWDAETICLRAIEREPRQRYQSATELARDLRSFLELRPITAQRPGGWQRARTFVRRHPAQAMVGILLVLLLLGGPVAFALQQRSANEKIGQALVRAETSFHDALAAVDRMLTEVAQRDLRDVPQMEQVRGRLLAAASEFYGRFLAERGSDPALRRKAGRLAKEYGNVLERLGQTEAAERQLRQALAIAQELRAQFPERKEHRYDEAVARYSLGYLFNAAVRMPEAEVEWKETARLYQSLVEDEPENADFQSGLANSLRGLGGLFLRTGGAERARKVIEQARDANAALVARHPERREFQEALAACWQALGQVYRISGRHGGSRTAFQRAIDIQERLAGDKPQDAEHRHSLGIAWGNLGSVLDELGEREAAHKARHRAIEIRSALARDFPGVVLYRRDLGNARAYLAESLLARSRLEEAEAEARAAIPILEGVVREQPEHAQHRSDLGLAWMSLGAVLGKLERAAESLEALVTSRRCHEEAIARDAADGNYCVRLARTLALMGSWHLNAGDRRAALPFLEECAARCREGVERVALPFVQALLAEQLRLLVETRLAEGDAEQAAAEALELGLIQTRDQARRVTAAKLLARCAAAVPAATRTHLEERAMAILAELADAGGDGLDPLAPEFDALRGRADFVELFGKK